MQTTSFIGDMGIQSKHRVLILMPHPDDETYTSGGLIQKLLNQGVRTRIVVLTRGEKSTLRRHVPPDAELGHVRQQEYAKAMMALGVKEHKMYDFPDGALENDEGKVRSIVKEELVSFNPRKVVTYEPSGVYGHPDHIALSLHVNGELKRSDQNIDLIYTTVEPNYRHDPDNIKMAKDPSSIRPLKPTVQLKLNTGERWRKLCALRCHRSQMKIPWYVFPVALVRQKFRYEYFYVV